MCCNLLTQKLLRPKNFENDRVKKILVNELSFSPWTFLLLLIQTVLDEVKI